MTLDEIGWMNKLFETRNMTKAAEQLFVSQPALSQCLRRIEQQLGFTLFSRSNKGLVPTERGLLFAQTVRTITDAYQEFLVKAELSIKSQLGEIVIGMPPFLSACCSAEVVEQLQDALPEVRFSVHEGSLDVLLVALRENEIQLAVTTGPLELEDVRIHSFGRGRLVIFLRKGSPVAAYVQEKDGKRYLDPALLQDEPLATTKPGQATRRLAEKLIGEAGLPPEHVRQESRHIETLYRYARKGIATAIAPLMSDSEEKDETDRLICYIPEHYRWSFTCGCIVVRPELDRLIPRPVFDILEKNVLSSSTYLKQV